jgi:hypothetical protein
MGDWDDIALVGDEYVVTSGDEPSLDGVLRETRLAWPSDAAIAGFIRAANRWHPDTPVPSSLVAEWRARIVRLAYQRWWSMRAPRRRRMLRIPPDLPRRHRRAVVVIIELLNEPWARVGLAMLTAAAALQLWAMREAWHAMSSPRWRPAPRNLLSPVLRYAHAKARAYGPTPPETWDAVELSPWHIAAVNAVSAAAAAALHDRIAACSKMSRYRVLDALLAELESIGREAVSKHGEWLCDLDPGPPRALVPVLPSEIERARATRKKVEKEGAAAPTVPEDDAATAGGPTRVGAPDSRLSGG